MHLERSASSYTTISPRLKAARSHRNDSLPPSRRASDAENQPRAEAWPWIWKRNEGIRVEMMDQRWCFCPDGGGGGGVKKSGIIVGNFLVRMPNVWVTGCFQIGHSYEMKAQENAVWMLTDPLKPRGTFPFECFANCNQISKKSD